MTAGRSTATRQPGSDLILCLTFHGIGDPPRSLQVGEADVWCSEAEMEAILDLIAGRDDVLITSDDGNRSDLEVLAPALARRGLAGTFFILAGRLGSTGFLNEADVRELLKMGMSVGSHGWDHVSWRRLTNEIAERELNQASQHLEEVCGAKIRAVACPFGAYGRQTLQRLSEHGFERVYSSDGGWASKGDRPMARNSIGRRCGTDGVLALLERPGIGPLAALKRMAKRWR